MKLSLLRYSVILVVFLAGCPHDCFEVEVRPAGRTFHRKLTCWHVAGKDDKEIQPLSPEQLAQIGRLYPKRAAPDGAKKQVFSGQFTDQTPADVGGAGYYIHFTSPPGSASCYVERFRGNDDLESQLSQRRQAAEQLTDVLVGWLTAEAGRDPNFPRLKKFLDEDLRRDLKNLGVYEFTGRATEECQKDSNGECLVRAGLYLCERGYFSSKEIPMLARAAVADDRGPLLHHVQRLLARKMGVADEQPVPGWLAFLDDQEKLTASFEKYVRSTDLFHQRLAQWNTARKRDPKAQEPTPEQVAGELFDEAAGFHFFSLGPTGDSLELKLFCGRKPYATNGQWDAKATAATWTASLDSSRALPAVCFASWSDPDRAFQEKHFGKIVLSDGRLGEYVLWYRLLKPEEAAEWDRFLNGLKPGPGLKAAVEAFRFSTDPKPDRAKPKEHVASLADTPRGLIHKGLEEKGSKTP
jgi:hypothetical protein